MGAGGAHASLQAPGLPVQGLFSARYALSEVSHSLCASQLDNALGKPIEGFGAGLLKVPARAFCGARVTRVSACFTAAATQSTTGTGIRSATLGPRPASGAPARSTTSAWSSSTARQARETRRSAFSSCTALMARNAPFSVRMDAQRFSSPCHATHSRYQGSSADAKVTIAKRPPNMQAVSIPASAKPITGIGKSSRAPPRPGSAKAAITAASTPVCSSDSISNAIAPPITASARVAI